MAARQTAFIGIGSNLGDSLEHCRRACDLLARIPESYLKDRSALYRTEPYGKADQPAFINAAVRVETHLEPRALLDALLAIEHEMGRERREKWGPRIIDLDLLLYENRVMDEPGLQIPHPDLTNRPFVLEPLCDLAPYWFHPVLDKTLRELRNTLGATNTVERLDLKLWRRGV